MRCALLYPRPSPNDAVVISLRITPTIWSAQGCAGGSEPKALPRCVQDTFCAAATRFLSIEHPHPIALHPPRPSKYPPVNESVSDYCRFRLCDMLPKTHGKSTKEPPRKRAETQMRWISTSNRELLYCIEIQTGICVVGSILAKKHL